MQIIQAGPNRQTLRQAAIDQAMGNIMGGIGQLGQQAQTERQQALQNFQIARDLRSQGYNVTPEDVAKNLAPEQSGFSKWLAKTPIGQTFGMEVQGQRPDLYGKRTRDWEDQNMRVLDDRKRQQMQNDLDIQLKQAQINKMNAEAGGGNLPWEQTKEGRNYIGKKQYDQQNLINGKDAQEFEKRYNNIIGEANQLNNMIKDKGTFEAFGPHNQTLAQKIDSIATDAAKLFDPQSVAREGEVAAFRKMLFEPGSLTTSNNTAIGTVNSFKNLMADRYSRAKGIPVTGDIPASEVALSPINMNGNTPSVNFNPINPPNMGPVNNAYASDFKNVHTNDLVKRRQEILQKAGRR